MHRDDFVLGILEAGILPTPQRREHGRFSEVFTRLLEGDPRLRTTGYAAYLGELPGSVEECDGYLVTGGFQSVYDGFDWIENLKTFVREAAGHSRKVVGICFGHQVLAEAFGGKVVKSDKGWGLGVHRHQVLFRKEWMRPALDSVSLIVSHQDQIILPPETAEVLAGNEFCPVAIMQVGANVMSIQSHPEVPMELAASLIHSKMNDNNRPALNAALASLASPTHNAEVASWIGAFLLEN
jgi:GMP synthase-like glutamine amidotransferase